MADNIETLTNRAANNGEIVLTVDEPSRTLKYEGELLLGVEFDYQAEKIYFEFPKIVGNNIDLSSNNIQIFINFKNGYNEPYVQECTGSKTVDSDVIKFYWVLNSYVTAVKGNVEFVVCIKNNVSGEVANEWHTRPFIGTVVKGVDVGDAHEIIEDPTVSTAVLNESVKNLQATLAANNTYVKNEVEGIINNKFGELEDRLEDIENPLVVGKAVTAMNTESAVEADHATTADSATKATKDGNGNVITDTYLKKSGSTALDLKIADKEGVVAVVLDPDRAVYTINNKKITTEPTVNKKSINGVVDIYTTGNLAKGETVTLELRDEELGLEDGYKLRFYFDGGADYPTCQSGVLEILIAQMNDYGDDPIFAGRGCFMSTLGGQDLIIGVEVISSDIYNNYRYGNIYYSVHALSDVREKSKSHVYLSKIEIVKP